MRNNKRLEEFEERHRHHRIEAPDNTFRLLVADIRPPIGDLHMTQNRGVNTSERESARSICGISTLRKRASNTKYLIRGTPKLRLFTSVCDENIVGARFVLLRAIMPTALEMAVGIHRSKFVMTALPLRLLDRSRPALPAGISSVWCSIAKACTCFHPEVESIASQPPAAAVANIVALRSARSDRLELTGIRVTSLDVCT